MTIPDAAVQAMPERIYAKTHGASTDVISGQRGLIGGWNEHKRDGQIEFVRADLALPFLQGVKVKGLEWHDLGGFSAAPSGVTRYSVIKAHNGKGDISWSLEINSRFSSQHDTLDAAKAAAQADYAARILSAIEVAPSPRAQALEELLSDDMLKDISTEFISWKGENPYKVHRGGYAAWEVEKPALKAALSFAIRALSSQPVADGVDSIEVIPSSGCVFADMGVERPVADGWLPIETAPKDMTPILCVCMKASPEFEQHIGYMAVDCWFDQHHGVGRFNSLNWPATHWRPLPASPGASDTHPTGGNHGE